MQPKQITTNTLAFILALPKNKKQNAFSDYVPKNIGMNFSNRAFCLIAILFLLAGWNNVAKAQSVTPCTTAVSVANFEVDGDFYANTIATGDDWFFSNRYPGPGVGVIGTTAATAT